MRILACLLLCGIGVSAKEPVVPIGTTVDNLQFKDIRYLTRSLSDLGAKRAYVLVFVDSDCPLVQKYLPVLDRLERMYRAKGVQFLAVNSGPHDTITTMAAQAIDFDCAFPFVKDSDCHVADALGVQRTPEVVILDAKRTLRYRGRIDDQYRIGGQRKEPTRHDLVEALNEILDAKQVTTAVTPVDGCLLNRPTKSADPAPTYTAHVGPLLKQHCQGCHRPNTAAPFALTTYEQAKAKAATIAEVVNDARMPPWFASMRDGDRLQHHHLSANERDLIVRWAKAGAPQGNGAGPEPLPEATAKWRIGEPDLVLKTSDFELPKEGDIPYKYLVLSHVFTEDTWVQGVQIMPSHPRAVHHANLAYFKLGENFKESNFVTGIVPNGEPMTVAEGIAYRIPKGSLLGLQVHYVTTGKPDKVNLSVGIKYASGKVDKQMRHMLFVDTRYTIPANDAAYPVQVQRTLTEDIVGIGLFAHMHVRGKAMTFTATLPDGTQDKLLTIANYNFEWQLPYRWQPGQKVLPKGTKIVCTALYDNSSFNPFNPDATKPVKDGPQTYHEMLNGFMFYVAAHEKLGLEIDPKTGRVKK